MRHPRIKRDAEDERPEKSDSRLGRKKQHETTTITPPRSSSEQSKVCMKQANATECKYGTMQSRTFSTRIRVLVPRLDSRSCLVSFAHALFKGLAETLQSASFRMYSFYHLFAKKNEKVNSVNSSVNSFQRFFTCAACLRHFLQISSSLAERLEQLLKHLSECESDTNGFLEDLDRPCQLPWPRFSKHLARRRGLLRPGS